VATTKKFQWKNPGALTAWTVAVMVYDLLWAASGLAIDAYWGREADYLHMTGDEFDGPQLIGWLHDVLNIPGLLLLLIPMFWILRVSKNAHVLKGRPLTNSPMFAALWWYLIPFMSLFKPVESLGEIWDVSATGVVARNQMRFVLPIWWGALLLGNGLRIFASRMDGTDQMQDLAIVLETLGYAASVIQCTAFIAIALRIRSMQMDKRTATEFSDPLIEQGILQGLSA
jgi:hypothetical protein